VFKDEDRSGPDGQEGNAQTEFALGLLKGAEGGVAGEREK